MGNGTTIETSLAREVSSAAAQNKNDALGRVVSISGSQATIELPARYRRGKADSRKICRPDRRPLLSSLP
jgi:hypothetical protein